MVIDRAGLLLFHPRFIEKADFDEPHLAELVRFYDSRIDICL